QICAEAETLLSEQAGHDLSLVQTEHPTRLQIEALQRFSRPRQRQILRYWLAGLATEYGFPQADYNCLERILHELLPAPDDANPLVSWSNNESAIQIRRFAGALYALAPFTEEAGDKQLNWLLPAPLELGAQLGRLELVPVATDGIDLDAVSHLTVAFREGGEVAKAAGRKTRSLKKIFQDYRVPPWLRSRIPLLYLDGELLAVADLFITSSRHRKQGKNLYRFHWSRPDIHCGY
ncbi:MAG: tRNA lysidine(34) synthetase TilS, partial [Pseudohongiellaceae bacterium]